MKIITKEVKEEAIKTHIAVCICTYKRPEMLRNLLKSLYNQSTDDFITYSIIVVDNDKLRSAEKVVAEIKSDLRTEISYLVEENKNIALARNKAIYSAKGDLIAFIDDDEIPEERWLLTLYEAMIKYKADAVLGPVFPLYEVRPPAWVTKGKFHQRPIYKSGFSIDWNQGRTGNLLIKRNLFDITGIYFDPRFGKGGEDQDFTRKMLERGFKFIWCSEAIAYEIIPPERWNIKNMLIKSFIRGKMSSQYPGSKIVMTTKSLVAISIYLIALPFLLLVQYHLFVQYLIKTGDHIGRITAILFKSLD